MKDFLSKKVDQIILLCKYMLTDLDSSFVLQGIKPEQKTITCFLTSK